MNDGILPGNDLPGRIDFSSHPKTNAISSFTGEEGYGHKTLLMSHIPPARIKRARQPIVKNRVVSLRKARSNIQTTARPMIKSRMVRKLISIVLLQSF
jgi:hypothetical protein